MEALESGLIMAYLFALFIIPRRENFIYAVRDGYPSCMLLAP